MLLIITLLILVAAAVIIIAKRQTRSDLLDNQTPKYLHGEDLRPLFAPDEEELRALELEERKMLAGQQAEEREKERQKKLESFDEFRQTWRESPGRTNTIELLLSASQTESGKIFTDVVDEILHKRTEAFSSEDFAQLIESHFWLLPQNERTPGVKFTINRELAALRGGSHTKSEEEASDAKS